MAVQPTRVVVTVPRSKPWDVSSLQESLGCRVLGVKLPPVLRPSLSGCHERREGRGCFHSFGGNGVLGQGNLKISDGFFKLRIILMHPRGAPKSTEQEYDMSIPGSLFSLHFSTFLLDGRLESLFLEKIGVPLFFLPFRSAPSFFSPSFSGNMEIIWVYPTLVSFWDLICPSNN